MNGIWLNVGKFPFSAGNGVISILFANVDLRWKNYPTYCERHHKAFFVSQRYSLSFKVIYIYIPGWSACDLFQGLKLVALLSSMKYLFKLSCYPCNVCIILVIAFSIGFVDHICLFMDLYVADTFWLTDVWHDRMEFCIPW